MTIKLDIALDVLGKRMTDAVIDGLNESVDIIRKSIDEKTPEDTGELLGKNKVSITQTQKYETQVTISNDTDYAKYVEYGRNRLGKQNTYHKPKGVPFYRGIGARMFSRTKLEKENEVKQLIKNKVSAEVQKFNRK